MGIGAPGQSKSVGPELAAVLPHDAPPWYKQPHLLRLNIIIVLLTFFASSTGYDGSLMNGLQTLDSWQDFLHTPTGAYLGFINAAFWIGMGVSYPIAAMVTNVYGRRKGVYVGYAFLILSVTLQTAAQNSAQFILGRLFVGCASAWFGNSIPLLINELAYPTHRGVLNALYNCGWYIGGTLAAWITFATRDYSNSWAWRVPSLCQAICPVVAFPAFLLAPESPRWLLNAGRREEAHQIMATAHAGGDLHSPLVMYQMTEIENTLQFETEAHASASYMDMFKTKGNRHRLFISVTLGIFAQWAGNGVVSYYLALVLDTVGVTSTTNQLIISACLQMWNLIFAVVAAINVDNLGRRKLFLASAGIMLISYILITGLSGSFAESGNAATGAAVIPFLFIFFAGYDIALTPFIVSYPCEIWPYRLRSRGLAVTWVSSISAIFFNTFVNPIALDAIAWKYYFVFVGVLVCFGITVYFFYPETRGYSLEQMAVIFDSDEAEVAHAAETLVTTADGQKAYAFGSDHIEQSDDAAEEKNDVAQKV